ncbi:MAG: long-chain-fatty-acid--CoA ligase [Planctomycetota bacterium]|nr:long-chain-fatty-acid--CoA ligase [Planctomycetota bacterium]
MGVPWLNLGQNFRVLARKNPDRLAFKDPFQSYTFGDYNRRVNKVSNALLRLGLKKGDKISCVMDNIIEIVDLYLATAKTGIVLNPVNFRLSSREIEYIVNHCDSKALFVQQDFISEVEAIRKSLPNVKYFVCTAKESVKDYLRYDDLLSSSSEAEPNISVEPEDVWVILYTSGTTGKPKGVVRTHESYTAFYLINAIDFDYREDDICLTVMPLCHVNSTFFSFAFTYIGATVCLTSARKFDPLKIFELIDREKITFISLIPTHYNLMLAVPEEERKKYDLRSIRQLLCSSAPVRRTTKLGIMELFKGVRLYEGYGSTEAGIVTVLKPDEQLNKLGSIGRESLGTDFVKLLDEKGNEVPVGEVGEIFSRGPMLFKEYYKMPEKTAASFKNGWFSAGDMGRKDEDGYFYIVDRKDNMIITGGEHVYPSEVEEVICQHPAVMDCAVIGVPDEKWGEAVKAVVVLKDGAKATEQELIEHCRGKMAAFKRPKSVDFIKSEEMPRTPTGKILHRILRSRYQKEP